MPNPLNYKVVCWRGKEGDFLLLKRICTTHGTYCQIPLLILTIGTPSAFPPQADQPLAEAQKVSLLWVLGSPYL